MVQVVSLLRRRPERLQMSGRCGVSLALLRLRLSWPGLLMSRAAHTKCSSPAVDLVSFADRKRASHPPSGIPAKVGGRPDDYLVTGRIGARCGGAHLCALGWHRSSRGRLGLYYFNSDRGRGPSGTGSGWLGQRQVRAMHRAAIYFSSSLSRWPRDPLFQPLPFQRYSLTLVVNALSFLERQAGRYR